MKKVRTIVNVVLGSIIAALGITSCENASMEYPIEKYGCPVDTTVHCMYGVNPDIQWDDPLDEAND